MRSKILFAMESSNMNDEKRELVIARFRTLNPEAKMIFGDTEITVREVIKHVEQGDEFGRKIVDVQIRMLQLLARASF